MKRDSRCCNKVMTRRVGVSPEQFCVLNLLEPLKSQKVHHRKQVLDESEQTEKYQPAHHFQASLIYKGDLVFSVCGDWSAALLSTLISIPCRQSKDTHTVLRDQRIFVAFASTRRALQSTTLRAVGQCCHCILSNFRTRTVGYSD